MASHDIFLSYSRSDSERAGALAGALEQAGFSVFLDSEIHAGESWTDVIGQAIQEARAVVALWSQHSVTSAWLLDEASLARDQNKLIPVLIEQVEPPLGFRQIQSADLTRWNGRADHPDFLLLLDGVKAVIGGAQTDRTPPTERREGARERLRGRDRSVPVGVRVEAAREQPYVKPMMAPFSSVFIAHSGADKPRIKPVLEVLIASGFVVWIDRPNELKLTKKQMRKVRGISLAADWQRAISQAVQKSRVVLAFWSNDAVDGRRERFYYELYMGMVQRKLLQCRIDTMPPQKIGLPFTFEQMADLKDFEPGAYNADLDDLMLQIARFQPRRL